MLEYDASRNDESLVAAYAPPTIPTMAAATRETVATAKGTHSRFTSVGLFMWSSPCHLKPQCTSRVGYQVFLA
jgi:hypothetical protein